MAEKRNIFLIGPTGSGKSTIGRQLAQQLNMEFFDSDQEIEKRTGADISWVFDLEGESGFRDREKKIINELTKKQRVVLATGVYSIKSKNTRNVLSARGIVIYLSTTFEKQIIRTKRDKKRILLKDTDFCNNLETITKKYIPLYKEIADITIKTDENNTKSVTKKIINLLNIN